jgi:hypothetical protein
MGLDMYLYAEKYISASDTFRKDDPDMYKAGLEAVNMNHLPKGEFGHILVKAEVAYWRKANAIHGWIIRNCADGIDECQEIIVSSDKLTELRDECVKALANRHNATKPKEADYVSKIEGDKDIIEMITESMKRQSMKSNTQLDSVVEPLAPTEGFFFGSTEKDEYYYKDLEYTVEVANSLLTNKEDYVFIYRASW